MNRIRLVPTALAITALLLGFAGASEAQVAGQRGLVGSWNFQIGFVDCSTGNPLGPQFSTIHTYHFGGTLTELGSQVGPPPTADRTSGLGIWQRRSGRTFDSYFKFFTFNGSSAPHGWIEVDEEVTLDAGGQTLTAVAFGRVFNAAGQQVASNCLAGTGSRVALP